MDKFYVDTVRLLLATLPEVFAVPKFALKGGTALNLFVQNMPRLSVDIHAALRNRGQRLLTRSGHHVADANAWNLGNAEMAGCHLPEFGSEGTA